MKFTQRSYPRNLQVPLGCLIFVERSLESHITYGDDKNSTVWPSNYTCHSDQEPMWRYRLPSTSSQCYEHSPTVISKSLHGPWDVEQTWFAIAMQTNGQITRRRIQGSHMRSGSRHMYSVLSFFKCRRDLMKFNSSRFYPKSSCPIIKCSLD